MKTIALAVFLFNAPGAVPDESSTLLRLVPRPRDAATSRASEPAHPLLRLTAPSHTLPQGCRLASKSGFESVKANPALLTDPDFFGFMHFLVVGWDTAWDDALRMLPEEERERTMARSMAERAAAVEAAYVAWYDEGDASRSIGVYALQFRRRLTNSAVDNIRRNAPLTLGVRIITNSVAIFTWTNAKEGAADLGCFDAVRKHLQNAKVD